MWRASQLTALLFFFSVLRVSTLHLFTVGEDGLLPHTRLPLPHCPLDLTFDPRGRLWVLTDRGDAPLRVYAHRRDCWEVRAHTTPHHGFRRRRGLLDDRSID